MKTMGKNYGRVALIVAHPDEETLRAVLNLRISGAHRSKEILLSAYENGEKSYLPMPIDKAQKKRAFWQGKTHREARLWLK